MPRPLSDAPRPRSPATESFGQQSPGLASGLNSEVKQTCLFNFSQKLDEPVMCLRISDRGGRRTERFRSNLSLRLPITWMLELGRSLLENDVKTKRLKTGDKTTRSSSGFWSFYSADNRARGRVYFGADLFHF